MTKTVLFFVYSNKYICADRIDGARRYAKSADWTIQVIERNNADSPLDVRGIVKFWNPIGVIAEWCGGGIPEISAESIGDVPLVYLDEDPSGGKGSGLYVNSNSSHIGELAAKELLSLNLPNYAFAGWRRPRFWSEERCNAFVSAIKLHGRECEIFDCPPESSELQRREMMRDWLRSLPKPCGVFAVHDPVGEEMLTLAAVEGIAVPEELAVIGVDDDPVICERTVPTLSSIRLDFEQCGYICAELLDRRLRDPSFSQVAMKFEPIFVSRRQSTGRLAHADHRVVEALEYIRRNACNCVRLDDVAATMGLSRRMAAAVFRKQTGRSIHEETTSVRMERVERLLKNPRQDISAIAGLCGWASGAVLRKLFKDSHDGLSMREWRKKELG